MAIAIGVGVFEFGSLAVGVDVNLAWDAPQLYTDGTPAGAVAGYRVYSGTSSSSYSDSEEIPSQTSATLTGLPDAATLFFSVTALATNGTESALSDELIWERRSADPLISPPGGGFQDSVQVALSTTTSGATIRYTIDGSTPTSGSAVYSGPFTLTQSATVRAVAMKSGLQNSGVSAAGFTIATDTTPPTLDVVHAVGDDRKVILEFSEPLNISSATTPGNYEIIPGIAVESATIDSSMRIVTLHTSALLPGTTYTLSVTGVRDQSPQGNTISLTLRTFEFQDLVRTSDGLIALYSFDELGGQIVHDESNFESPLDLTINDLSKVSWIPGALRINNSTKVSSTTAPLKINQTCKSSDEFTIELWVRPSNVSQDGPARIATISQNSSSVANVMVGAGRWGSHASDVIETRIRTSVNDFTSTTTPAGSLSTALQHIVVTRKASGMTKTYVNGVEKAAQTITGTLDTWGEAIPLVLANESDGNRPWLGEFHLMAVYGRGLTLSEILQNLEAGPEFTQGPQNPPPDDEPSPATFLDNNQNGMQDDWETENFNGMGLAASPSTDGDRDGLSNLEEYLAGTDPTDGANYFGVKIACKDGAPNVSFFAARTETAYGEFVRFYTLEKCDPVEGRWAPVPGLVRVPGSDSDLVHIVPDSNDTCILFRAKTWLEHIPGDSDHNGLVDSWEASYLVGSGGGNADATVDTDEDGLSNLQEFILGTDPGDAVSGFPFTIAVNNGRVEVSFFASRAIGAGYAGHERFYRLEHGDPATGEWAPVEGFDWILGNDTQVTYGVPSDGADCVTYRVAAWLVSMSGDADKDWIQDAWESAYLQEGTQADSSADQDGDGVSNLQEFILGTHPANISGSLPVYIDMIDGQPHVMFAATEASGPGYDDFTRYFRLEKQVATGTPWIPVTGYERIEGDNTLVSYPMTSQDASCTLYRATAWLERSTGLEGDADGDGILDAWESQFFGSTSFDGSTFGDTDGDGFSNMQEFIYGTDPGDGTSYFAVRIEVTGGNPRVTFWAADADGSGYEGFARFYRLETGDPVTGIWTTVPGYDRIPGHGDTVSHSVPESSGACSLYRVAAWLESTSTSSAADSDVDGLPDTWELSTFVLDGSESGPDADPDGDHFSNIQEFVFGTDPGSGTSYSAVNIRFANGAPQVYFQATETSGTGYDGLARYYRLKKCIAGTGAWETVAGYDRIPGTGTEVQYNVPPQSNPCTLYSLEAWLESQ